MKEWWLAPVIYHELTRGGDDTPLKQWAANHIWLAQRTGGAPLHGVEMTSRIVFGKEAKDLTIAEQFVLASAVNKPIILLAGNDKLNEVRLDRWRYITEVRARTCAEQLIEDEARAEAGRVRADQPRGRSARPAASSRSCRRRWRRYAPALAKRAQANPTIRANALMPAARFGMREEMKQAYGFGWREYVRGVTTTLDVVENLAFHERIKAQLAKLDTAAPGKINPGFTLDPAKVAPAATARCPTSIVVAANAQGRDRALLRGRRNRLLFRLAVRARSPTTGRYDAGARGPRMIASTGKILAAIAHRQRGPRPADTLYLDRAAPAAGLEGCDKGGGRDRAGRRAIVAFACSLNRPIEWRAAQLGQARMRRLIDGFGFNMPPATSGRRRHAALDGGGARPDRRLAAPGASDGGRGAGGADRAGPPPGAAADAGRSLRFHDREAAGAPAQRRSDASCRTG